MTVEEVFQIIARHTCEVLPELESHHFEPHDSLRRLGANSIDRLEIVMMTLESLSLNIPLVETVEAENIGQLATLLHGKLQ
jgi:polyketide biosynthesis acyl carrier protein